MPRCRRQSMPTCGIQQHTSHGDERIVGIRAINGAKNATERLNEVGAAKTLTKVPIMASQNVLLKVRESNMI